MNQTENCETSERLQELLDGALAETEQAQITTHLERCARCQRELESLVAGEKSWDDLARNLGSKSIVDPEETKAEATLAENTVTALNDQSIELGTLDHYELKEKIGQGAFGTVYRAFDTKLQRIVAIKVLSPELAASGTARQRFIREARAAAAVTHEHVVAIHAIEEQHRPPYIVMQMVDGVSLQQKIDDRGPLELREILRIGMQIASGLAAAHKQGLVHRDIKPANVLLENGIERVKITDFGLARAVDDASISTSGVIAGTPTYMSPEQADGQAVDHRSDLFSLGTVLYVMCTGRSPFRAGTTMAVLRRVCEDAPTPITQVNSDVPNWLCNIVDKLHAKNPDERFQSADEAAALLQQHLAHLQQPAQVPRPAPIEKPEAPEQPPRRDRRWPLPRLVYYAIVVYIVVGLSGTLTIPLLMWKSHVFLTIAVVGVTLIAFCWCFRPVRPSDSPTMRRRGRWASGVLGLFALALLSLWSPAVREKIVDTWHGINGRGNVTLIPEITDKPDNGVGEKLKGWTPQARVDLARLKGEWVARVAKMAGKPLPLKEVEQLGIRFGDGDFELRIQGQGAKSDAGTFRIEADKKQLLLSFKGRNVPVRCSYRLDGDDRLRLDFAGLLDNDAKKKAEDAFRNISERVQSRNKLMQLAMAMLNYHTVNKAFPPAVLTDTKSKDGKPLLSWRVALLPHVEENLLYRQFKLDEPWDSEHNRKLVDKMPKVFAAPGITTPEPGMSHYRVFAGPGTVFESLPGRRGIGLGDIHDGTSNTLMIAEAAEPVIWTKPDPLPFDPKKPLPKLGVYGVSINVAFLDGSVHALAPDASDEALRTLITRNGGELLSVPFLKPEPPQGPPLYLELERRRPLAPDRPSAFLEVNWDDPALQQVTLARVDVSTQRIIKLVQGRNGPFIPGRYNLDLDSYFFQNVILTAGETTKVDLPETGTLRIETADSATRVEVDGIQRFSRRTSDGYVIHRRLTAGKHNVRVTRGKDVLHLEVITIEARKTHRIRIDDPAAKLEGVWSLIQVEMGGKVVPIDGEKLKKVEIHFGPREFEMHVPGEKDQKWKGTYRIDLKTKKIILEPKDVKSPMSFPLSYRLDKDRLTLDFTQLTMGPPPKSNDKVMMHFERQQPKKDRN